ncbi:hypothetical protein, partial [Gordonia sp. i37]|uniref:hypothetical protein n=1 Tax=Gordonia sp. i37 TaxID=1961707 RepID=UPI00209AB4DC
MGDLGVGGLATVTPARLLVAAVVCGEPPRLVPATVLMRCGLSRVSIPVCRAGGPALSIGR